MYSKKFERAIIFVLKWEGGYTIDTGGETKYGISKRAYPDLDIKNLTLEDAMDIYKENYWDKLELDKYNYKVAVSILDMAVNMGKKRAIKIVQQACNKILEETNTITEDGILGPKTKAAISTCKKLYPFKFVMWINILRQMFYSKLAKRNKYKPYYIGWINRSLDLQSHLLEDICIL